MILTAKAKGDFVNDRFNGKGKFTYPDGGYYEGDFVNGEMHGQGKRTYADGTVYEGDFVGGNNFTGKGKMVYGDGRVKEGNWENGEFVDEKKVKPDDDISDLFKKLYGGVREFGYQLPLRGMVIFS